MLKNFDQLIEKARKSPKKIVVAAAEDPHVIQAILDSRNKGIARFVLTGDQKKIKELIRSNGGNPDDFEVIAVNSFEEAAYEAVQTVLRGEAEAIMKGLTPSPVFLKAVLSELKVENDLLSHVALLKVPGRAPFFASDCAVNIEPDAEDKVKIIRHAVEVARKLGWEKPNVALVTASESVNPKMKDTQQAADITQRAAEGLFEDAVVGGPFALDNAISKEAAELKKVSHPGAGEADILILPDLNAANIFYKSLIFYAHAESAGLILGAKVPIILVSRADSEETKMHSIALAGAVS
jgi:phosphate butyryltransferase